MARDRNRPRLQRMMVLTMASLSPSQMPAVLFQPSHHIADLHSLGRGVEKIVRSVTALGFCVAMGRIAAFRGWLSTLGVNSLNCRHIRKQSFSGMTRDFHQQPGN